MNMCEFLPDVYLLYYVCIAFFLCFRCRTAS